MMSVNHEPLIWLWFLYREVHTSDVQNWSQQLLGHSSDYDSCTERWAEAHKTREELLEFLTCVSGVGTLLDHRRYEDYDADKNVDRYLNQPAVKVRPLHQPREQVS
jgi:hypothetical protein